MEKVTEYVAASVVYLKAKQQLLLLSILYNIQR